MKIKYVITAAFAAAAIVSGTGIANAHFRHPAGYYAGPAVNEYGHVQIMDIDELEKQLQYSNREKIRQRNNTVATEEVRGKYPSVQSQPDGNDSASHTPKNQLPKLGNKDGFDYFKNSIPHHRIRQTVSIRNCDPKFFPALLYGSNLLLLNDIDHWKHEFNGDCKQDYMRIIATGLINQERLPIHIQRKIYRYGWNGYYYHLLKSKMHNERFFIEAANAMDRLILNERIPHKHKLWELAVIEMIHTLNIHSMERNV